MFVPKALFGCFFLIFLGVLSCVSQSEEQFHDEDLRGLPLVEDKTPLQSLSLDEVRKYWAGKLLTWAPFLLPTEDTTVRESHFLLGAMQKDGSLIPSQEGTCFFWGESLSKFSEEKEIKVKGGDKETIAGSLFFFKSQNTNETIGAGVFNAEGKASCKIRTDADVVVTGLSSADTKEFPFTLNSLTKTIEVELAPKTLLVFKPTNGSKLALGDIVRIGKLTTNSKTFLTRDISDSDLFRPTYSVENNFSAEEFLSSSVLIGSKPFKMALTQGNYLVAVLRAGRLICLKSIELNKDEKSVECASENFSKEKVSERAGSLIDFTPVPKRLLRSKAFFAWWRAQSQGTIFANDELRGRQVIDSNKITKNESILEYRVQESSFVSAKKYFEFSDSLPAKKSSYSRQLTYGLTMNSNLLKTKSMDDLIKNTMDEGIEFIAGTAKRALTEGAPFFSTFAYHPKGFLNQENNAYEKKVGIVLSNGVLMRINQPVLPDHAKMLSLKSGSKMRFEIEIPPGNGTDVLEIYHNQNVVARHVTVKTKNDEIEIFGFEHKVSENKDFWMTVVVKGDMYLPEFLVAQKWQQPYAVMLPFCVDVNEDKSCEANYGSK